MYRVTKVFDRWYYIEFDELEEELENIEELLISGEIVIICDDLSKISNLLNDNIDFIDAS